MTGNIHKLSDGTKLQNYLFSFLYGTQLQEKSAPSSKIDRSQLYIPRDACATFAVCKSWRKLDNVQNAQFLVWKEVFLRLFSSMEPRQFYYDKSSIEYLRKECTGRFKALAENIVTKEPTTFKPEIGRTYTDNPDTTGRCTLWNRWFFTCPEQGMIHGRTIRSVFYDISFAVPGDHPYSNISDFQVGHGKIVARGVELVRTKEQKEGEEEPKKEPLPEKLCFHVWDIASKNYSYWEMPGEKGCKYFQIVDPSTLLVAKQMTRYSSAI